ncbi:MAG: ferritin-like domain-containing protein [Clostridia bacterium]
MSKGSITALSSKLDVQELIKKLNVALSEEWLAYYQYWIGAQVIKGTMRSNIEAEFLEHAKDELDHANKISKRIIELEGIPVLNPKEWDKLAKCKFMEPTNFDSVILLNQNIESEDCAINRYKEIADFTRDKDYTTFDLAKKIMAEEEEHAQDLSNFVNDIDLSRKTYK